MNNTANVRSLMAMADKTPVRTPVHGILRHGKSKSGGDFWVLKDNDGNKIYVKFWDCQPPNIALESESVVTFYPDLSANEYKSTMKVTIYNGTAGLNINAGYRTELDSAPPPVDSRPATDDTKLAYKPDGVVGVGDSAQARTRQIAMYRQLCDNTVQVLYKDKGYTMELLKDISTSIFIQGTRDNLHKKMKVEEESDPPF